MTVYDDLRDLVVSGGLDPADRISETALAQRLEVSRTPVREALQRLDAEGLVHAAGRGIRVRLTVGRDLADLFEARAALEAHAAARLAELVAAGELAPARLAELDRLADATDATTRSGDLAAAAEGNRAFHLRVAELAGNRVIVDTLRAYWDRITVSTRAYLAAGDRAATVDDAHRDLLAAIAAGDPRAAATAAREHAMTTAAAIAATDERTSR
ncbi:GntR family transcriptional regulator [Agromyces larvae]|uniref:GntR family transcriptional regulator n=1 Tax=Agromyces larvae TaxID=2929802 RepID=A0ABY4C420_9MICO|nr:GntR family transcriptional regulator [Agromyces larvae]UOE45719.1 GntR family transcriptional regulator [Agromyces larvae]